MSCRNPWRFCAETQYRRLLSSPHHSLHAYRPAVPASSYSAAASSICRAALLATPSQRRFIHDDKNVNASPLLNPPASTRPPPLTLPQRSEFESTPKYLFAMSKGYLRFYKDGIKALVANWRLLREKLERTPAGDRPSLWFPGEVPRSFSRADWVLLWRVRHDMARLPLFGLLLILIGEWMAVVVLYVDGVVPYTCRIPKQIFNSLERAEARRKAAFAELETSYPHGVLSPRITNGIARSHVLRSLNLTSTLWDRMGISPSPLWQIRGRSRMTFLIGDDKNLVEDGGPMGLEYEELRIACSERGIDTLGKSKTELRSILGDWLRLTAAEDIEERRRRMAVLFLTRHEHWPQSRDFAVPEWTL